MGEKRCGVLTGVFNVTQRAALAARSVILIPRVWKKLRCLEFMFGRCGRSRPHGCVISSRRKRRGSLVSGMVAVFGWPVVALPCVTPNAVHICRSVEVFTV